MTDARVTLREWIGLAMMAGISAWLFYRDRPDGAIFVASLILQQLGLGSKVSKALVAATGAEASARSAARSGEYAAVRLDQLTDRKETRDG